MFGPRIRGDVAELKARYLEAAARAENYVDFGPLDFLSPFETLLGDLVHEARLSALGHLITPFYLMQILRMRLKVQRALAEGSPAPVERPIFILGLPRTGTTFLHELLADHPDLAAPTFWSSHKLPRDDWRDSLTKGLTHAQLAAMNILTPGFRRVHPLGTNRPHECVSVQGYAFRSMQFHAAYRLPTYNRIMVEGFDWQPAYDWHKKHLGLLPGANGRWVLKAPGHMLGIEALIRTYPDARFIQTHRDPAAVIPSMASLTAHLRVLTSRIHDPTEIGRDVLELWSHGFAHLMRARGADPGLDARFIDIDFEDLVRDPGGVLEQIGLFLDIEPPPAPARGRSSGPSGHRYSAEQFGLSAETIRAAFSQASADSRFPRRA